MIIIIIINPGSPGAGKPQMAANHKISSCTLHQACNRQQGQTRFIW
jgi:hypothetical protein